MSSSNSSLPTSIGNEALDASRDSAKQPVDTPTPSSSRDQPKEANAGKVESSKSEAEKEAERRYEELIEEEYAKREGGA